RQDALLGALSGILRLAGVAVRRALADVPRRLRRRIRLVEEILQEERRFLEIVAVHLADVEMQLAAQLRTERLPVALHDRVQVVMFLSVLRARRIYDARPLVVEQLRIAVAAHRAERRIEDVHLVAGAAAAAEHLFY